MSPSGCPNDTSPSSSCQQARGGLFDPKRSSSWKSFVNYSLELEVNLGYNDTAPYGLDTVALGFNDTLGGPALKSQIITDVATNDFYLGAFGLGHQDTYLGNFTNRRPSFLTAMKEEGLIPSLSWAYTAGARYRKYAPNQNIVQGTMMSPTFHYEFFAAAIVRRRSWDLS